MHRSTKPSPWCDVHDDAPMTPIDGRRVKIMRAPSSGHPAIVWEDSEFEKLDVDNVFVVVEPDGTEVPGGPWVARSPAYRNAENDGCWTVDCDALELF